MTPDRWQRVKELCALALEKEPAERARFLAVACADDESLRREVESMVGDATAGDGVLVSPVWHKMAIATGGEQVGMPATLGRYRLLRIIGEGGMGVVYEAEQDQPRRVVALKVIKPGLATQELLRRFERESQVLARLHHPGIAQIFEAGTADTGFGPQPYFAMELIHGAPIREYVDSYHLSTRQRLELMAKVCNAVEHAHERGIIHRDLKPGNILVEETGQPKVLDFGVARVTDSDAQVTRQTDLGQLVGTLAYMSPEQVLADPLKLDSRSDVYALGVILYELLASRLPYTLSRQLHEAVRTIEQEDPARLSSISRSYRGDVETIVAKALEKDKGRRYASAAMLAEDIRRHLADQPIAARPASVSYQMQKFARRHRALVTAVAVVFAVLVAGIVATTREALRARSAEQTAQAVNDFLQNDLLAQASANTQAGQRTKPDPDLKVRTAVDRAAARIGGKFAKQPEVEAAIRDTIGQTYIDLGLYREARDQFERARDLYRQVQGAESPKTLRSQSRLGRSASLQGKNDEAEALLNEALQAQRRLLGPEHSDTLYSLTNLAAVYRTQGKYEQAAALQIQILAIRRRVLGAEAPATLLSMSNLANVYFDQGRYEQAQALDSQALEIRHRVLGPEHPDTLVSMEQLAVDYRSQGKYGEAEPLYNQALSIQRQVHGPEHPDTLRLVTNLAQLYVDEGRYAEAESLYRENLSIQRRVLGSTHMSTLITMNNLAETYKFEGQFAQAEALLREALEANRRVLGPEHRNTLMEMENLASVYALQARYAAAEPLFRDTIEIGRRVLGPQHPFTLYFLSDFAYMYQREGNYSKAQAAAAEALAGRRHSLGSEHPETMTSAADLALAYVSLRSFAEAEPLAREAMEFFRKKQPDSWQRFRAESLLGASLAGQKKFAEAEPLLLEGYRGMLERKGRLAVPDRYHLDRAREWVVKLYRDWGKPEKAAALLSTSPSP
jgi:tetratricopeptide (TPR) repeat protein/tRNA A-37 threonylcarbamoyl transferase component Bud32